MLIIMFKNRWSDAIPVAVASAPENVEPLIEKHAQEKMGEISTYPDGEAYLGMECNTTGEPGWTVKYVRGGIGDTITTAQYHTLPAKLDQLI